MTPSPFHRPVHTPSSYLQASNDYLLMNKILRGKLMLKLAVLRHRFAESVRSERGGREGERVCGLEVGGEWGVGDWGEWGSSGLGSWN